MITLMGYKPVNKRINIDNTEEITIKMSPDPVLMGDGVTVTSSKSPVIRSNIETSVPIDIIDKKEIQESGKRELSQLLRSLAPSFNSGRQTFSDATDHIDPATLRSLGPDQVLVLINGKRRHTTSLVNVTPIVGKGSVGTDFNAIPVSSIERIEILRDGASAQYGSDAIAGVINIILIDDANNSFISTTAGQTIENDGQHVTLGSNFGFDLFDRGFMNVSLEARRREATNRANEYQGLIYRNDGQDGLSFEENFQLDNEIIAERGLDRSDFNLIIGNSAQTNASFFINSGISISDNTNLYAFGGINYRESRSAGFYRFPKDPRNNPEIYPNGFLPFLAPKIMDRSFSMGLETKRKGWLIDISNTFGSNRIDYFVENSLNRAWGNETPTNFNSGTTEFLQNTVNLDISKDYGKQLGLRSFNVSFGGEFRVENYQIVQGEESSWSFKEAYRDSSYPPGAQVFPGFRPENAVDESRHNAAGYLELESDVTDKLLLSAAGRFESYSDFGNTLNGKLTARYKFDELFLIRAAASTGFRAPSLHQQYFSNISTIFVDVGGALYPFDVATVNNDSRTAEAFGIGDLKEETSVNFSAGFTSRLTENTTLTVDAYQIDIDDRIVLSGYFVPAFDPEVGELLQGIDEADAAQFFSNAIDTRTRGIDIVFAHSQFFGEHLLGFTAALNLNETEIIGDVKSPENLDSESQRNTLFNREERARLTMGQPQNKVVLALNYQFKNFGIDFRNVRFGEVGAREATVDEETGVNILDQDYSGKWITDLEVNYTISNSFGLFVGANNIFDVYPDENKPEKQDFGRFPYNTAVTQFGFMGTYYYAGLNIRL
jgi:iron complex outermembrane receptor protein